jgi:hypothetical protein
MGERAFRQFLQDAFASALVATKPGGAIYVAHGDMQGTTFGWHFSPPDGRSAHASSGQH